MTRLLRWCGTAAGACMVLGCVMLALVAYTVATAQPQTLDVRYTPEESLPADIHP